MGGDLSSESLVGGLVRVDWRGALGGAAEARGMARSQVSVGDGAGRGDGARGCLRLVGRDFAGVGEVTKTLDEVFEAALQRCGGFGGEVGGCGDERPEQPQEELGEKEGGGAGCWGEHERKKNIVGWGWQGALVG